MNSRPARVTVVGSYITALVMDTEQLPIEGQTVVGRNFHTTFGGKGSNAAVCAARLGADAAFLGRIGRDSFGREFLEMLQREKVRHDGVLYSPDLPTGVGIILFSARGTNLIVIDPGANGQLSPADIRDNAPLIGDSDVIVSPLEIPLETALAAAEIATERGVKTILNPAPAPDMRSTDLASVFAFTPNETEARTCLGLAPGDRADDKELAAALLDLGPSHVILTRGERGVAWASKQGVVEMPALQVVPVDTVGAGDAFCAGLAVGLGEGMNVRDAIAMGITTASISTLKRETLDSYPIRVEVDERIGEVLTARGGE